MVNREKNLMDVAVYIFNRFMKTLLFIAVLSAVAYEYFVVKQKLELHSDMYRQLGDYNEYLLSLVGVLFVAIVYMGFGLFANRVVFLSLDLLYVLITILYLVVNYNAWNADIPSSVNGFLLVFENITLLVRGLWVVLAVAYFFCLIIKIIKQETQEVIFESGDLQQDMFASQLQSQKIDKLISIHKQLEQSKENLTEEEYQDLLRDVMREKMALHGHY